MRSAQSEALGLVVSCLGIIGLLAGFPGLSGLLTGVWGIALGSGALFGALLFLLVTLRGGKSLLGGVLTLTLFSGLAFGGTYGVMWYFMSYMPANGGLGMDQIFNTPSNSRNSFTSFLKAGNFKRAYDALSPEAQAKVSDPETFRRIITENNWQPEKWKWTLEKSDQQHAEYTGETTFKGDRTGIMQIWLDKIEKGWKVSAMKFQLD